MLQSMGSQRVGNIRATNNKAPYRQLGLISLKSPGGPNHLRSWSTLPQNSPQPSVVPQIR